MLSLKEDFDIDARIAAGEEVSRRWALGERAFSDGSSTSFALIGRRNATPR